VPAHVIFVAAHELPTTATGKVQKFRLIENARARLAAGSEPAL
jgi:fatty-acyl-CoA synthase